MKNNKFLSLVSFSRKAGKLVCGFDAVESSVKNGLARLVIIAQDASERTRQSVQKLVERKKDILVLNTGFTMADYAIICRKDYAVLAVEDVGFAGALYKLLEEELYDKKG